MTDDRARGIPGRLDRDGLARLHHTMAAHVASGALPGMVTLVARDDEVHVDAMGTPSFTDATPLRRDAIFRIASLSKPITAVAALSLVDEGRLQLDQSIDELLPELADRRVLRSIDAELGDTVAAARPITVEDLLSYRMGFGTVLAPPGEHPIQRAEAAARLQSIGGPPWPPVNHDPDSWLAALGGLPLMDQPGVTWRYGTSGQVLGVLLARACDQELGAILRERVLDPLGMADTAFSVAPDQLHCLTTAYRPDPEGGAPTVLDEPHGWWSVPPSFPDGAGGLVSTIDDLWAFVAMLMAGGAGPQRRVLSPATVELMTTDRLTAAQRSGATLFLGDQGGWGLGLSTIATGSTDRSLPTGTGWDGGLGTTWRTNPHTGVTGIQLTQRELDAPAPPSFRQDFYAGINAAT